MDQEDFREKNDLTKDEINEFFISFYKERYLYFLRVGIGNYTLFNTKVTDILIRTTANRLDQLIKGKVTSENKCHGLSQLYRQQPKYDSNRSFGWNNTSRFRYSELDLKQKNSIDCPVIVQETYIDKYTTAYRTIDKYNED